MSGRVHLACLFCGILAILAGCGDDPDHGPCVPVDCGPHGTCMQQGTDVVCVCLQGYHAEGLTCVADVDPCEGVECSGQASVDSGASASGAVVAISEQIPKA